MNYKNIIEDNILVICDNDIKRKILSHLNEETEIYDIKFMNINEVIKNEVHFDSPSDISLENAEKLEQMFREELDKADIDPNNMCFDKYPDAQEGPYKRARSYNNSE